MLHQCEKEREYNSDDSFGYGAEITQVYSDEHPGGQWTMVVTGSTDGPIFLPIHHCPFCGYKLVQ